MSEKEELFLALGEKIFVIQLIDSFSMLVSITSRKSNVYYKQSLERALIKASKEWKSSVAA